MSISAEHEERCEILEALGVLAGFTAALPMPLYDGSIPDVLRVDFRRGRAWIGDAKASESPGNRETTRRLARYAEWAVASGMPGWSTTLALCHPVSSAGMWLRVLRQVVRDGGGVAAAEGSMVLDRSSVVTWITLRPTR